MQDKLRALIDKDEIRDLRIRYSHLLDGNRIDELDEVFAADAVVEVTVGRMEGLDAIKAGLKDAYALFDRDGRCHYPFMHPIANHLIELTGPDTATGSCYLVDFETASKADPDPLLLLGLYADEYRRIDDAWRITRSRLDVVWPASSPPPSTSVADRD
ncbi:nuclear transport factor 2 family protein [Novosphingobium sp. YJ-S2-02]|uniref:Nuclear transport factor 2 family protein n=1 Tax=Novosphingobium aureum TaxID=2792964 RepID=A0A931HA84_9SPHN|nr:nuclear transport factor 2 family protein [Novosphingobium aureum]MBH0112097.1 nuclear transport factor 2 family protein [Novosphingobium aureum]